MYNVIDLTFNIIIVVYIVVEKKKEKKKGLYFENILLNIFEK